MRTAGRFAGVALLTMTVGLSLVKGSSTVRSWSEDYPSSINLHVRQAAAFLRGEVALDRSGLDAASYQGRWYVPFPPAPAVLMLPLVAILGEQAHIATAVCALLTALNVLTLMAILRRFEIPQSLHPWLVLAFFLGSGYWFVLSFSEGVWYSASVVAVTAQLLAVREAIDRQRGWLVGLCLGVAFLSRQFTILATPLMVLLMWETKPESSALRLRRLIMLAIPLAASVGLYLGFNRIRFGEYLETGYRYLPLDGYEMVRRDRYGAFSLAYVPVNLFHLLVHGFTVSFDSADRLTNPRADWWGTAVPAASPFVFLAFCVQTRTRVVKAIWATVGAMAFAESLYYVSGAGQLNWQRYALDYWPLLFVLIALGLRSELVRERATLWKVAIAYSVGLNALVLAYFDVLAGLLRSWTLWFART